MGIIIPQTLISKNINKNQKRKPNKPKENSDPDIAQLIDGLSRTRDKSPSASRIDRRTRVGQTHRFVYYDSYITNRILPSEIIPLSYSPRIGVVMNCRETAEHSPLAVATIRIHVICLAVRQGLQHWIVQSSVLYLQRVSKSR